MTQEFKRSANFSISFFIQGLIFAFITILLININGPKPLIALLSLTSLLGITTSIWSFFTPYLIFDGQTIYIKKSLFIHKQISISAIQDISPFDEKYMYLFLKDQSKVRIEVNQIEFNSRADFNTMILSIAANLKIQQ